MDNTITVTNTQLWQLALNTAHWCHAVIWQAKRFLDALDDTNKGSPWDELPSFLVPEKVFLITAIEHAIRNLQRLNVAMTERGDVSLAPVIGAIVSEEEWERITLLRNMNEHDDAYIVGKGHKQDKFISTISKNGYHFRIDPFTIFAHGDAGLFTIGNIEIKNLVISFKQNWPKISEITEHVFNDTYGKPD